MHLEWLAGPAPFYIFLAAGLALTVVLFVAVKTDLNSAENRARRRTEALESVVVELQARLETMNAELNSRDAVASLPSPFTSSLNLSKRAQAVRMSRRGESPEHIAAALSVPLKEVELLLKIHSLIIARF
jgi:hypothetical protein